FFDASRLQAYRRHAHQLVCEARRGVLQLPGTGVFCTPLETDFVSMCGIELPQPPGWKPGYHGHPDPLQIRLRDHYGIEVPVGSWSGHRFLRVSAHLYNTAADIRRLVEAVTAETDLLSGALR